MSCIQYCGLDLLTQVEIIKPDFKVCVDKCFKPLGTTQCKKLDDLTDCQVYFDNFTCVRADQCAPTNLYQLVDKLCQIVAQPVAVNKGVSTDTAVVATVCAVFGVSTAALATILVIKSKTGFKVSKKPNLEKTKQIENVDEIRE